jgi:hypothetical protein
MIADQLRMGATFPAIPWPASCLGTGKSLNTGRLHITEPGQHDGERKTVEVASLCVRHRSLTGQLLCYRLDYMNQDTDLQAQSISAGLTKLQGLLEKPVATGALELGKNAAAAKEYDVLRRLQRSLLQYLERNGALFYTGVLGHFSAGKSSTINSLLDTWNSKYERVTDLNPTDTTITLITKDKNASSLVGVIREGHVTIRLEPVDSPFLDEIVLVDTPGTGDPQFIEEVARDFLPICDLILFVFSATSPLDKSDVPLLLELHNRLPFVPIHFVVTRTDELRTNENSPLTVACPIF